MAIEFLLRAHSAPTQPQAFLNAAGGDAHVEYLAQIIVNTLFVSQGHREDDVLTLVLEQSADFSRSLTLRGESLGNLGGMTESALLDTIADALQAGSRLGKAESIVSDSGIEVSATSFERLARARLESTAVFLLDRKGADIREVSLPDDACFLLTDHIPLPRNLRKSFVRQGAKPVSLGPVMLHASQCVVLVQNEFDRLYSRR